jgi:S1-C subfamily serine protease
MRRRLIRTSVFFATLLAPAAFGFQNTPGLIVEELTNDSPGAKAGLQVSDRILSYDGKALALPAGFDAAQENTFGKERRAAGSPAWRADTETECAAGQAWRAGAARTIV